VHTIIEHIFVKEYLVNTYHRKILAKKKISQTGQADKYIMLLQPLHNIDHIQIILSKSIASRIYYTSATHEQIFQASNS